MIESTSLSDALCSAAEANAEKAEGLVAFSGFKLQHVKRQLAIMLGLIGRDGLFDQYTRHDISHINELIKMLDWLIPEPTKAAMTAADWLLITLSIYFHDFGMLVTKREYENRHASDFPNFKAGKLSGSDNAKDLREKLSRLPPEDSEKFLYQEYVRHHHARRIREWIQGNGPGVYGEAKDTAGAINDLMMTLPDAFRRDLGLVCESHHLDDLNDLTKYPVSQPYGNTPQGTANVQYAAILLRTVDILHMTSDRTPSVAFQLISPSDPTSQREWAKQGAVRSVRAQVPRNKDGNVDPALVADTVEVHALFKSPEGFFALTEFLVYVRSQLRRNVEWIKHAQLREGADSYSLPWKEVDERHVEANGFLSNHYEFSIDQAKVLDLLTGHTLYNDTRIVLRELLQNSIDAIRVQKLLDPSSAGRIHIRWNSVSRILEVQDDGTGMTQSIIESYLLRVGSSRYQDQVFKKNFPSFTPISRFGIGLLSCFMVADQVDIFTSHPEEPDARHLSLRTVHGRYLVRLLSKTESAEGVALGKHGTIVRLSVRSSASIQDIRQVANLWSVVPPCSVSLTIDEGEPIKIGHASLKDALKDAMQRDGLNVEDSKAEIADAIRIEESVVDGLHVVFGLKWSEWFKEWGFIPAQHRQEEVSVLGTCVEGIRVEFGTPGYSSRAIYAMANATGAGAPRTNVARSAFEAGAEHQHMLLGIYEAYAQQVRNEAKTLVEKRKFSVTWAAREAGFLLSPLLSSGDARATSKNVLVRVGSEIPLFLIEDQNGRRAASARELADLTHVWTIESELIRSAERMIGEVSTSGSIGALGKALGGTAFELASQPILCGPDDVQLRKIFLGKWAVDQIVAKRDDRRLDLRWSVHEPEVRKNKWANFPLEQSERFAARFDARRRGAVTDMHVNRDVEVHGLEDEVGVRSSRGTYLRKDTELNSYLLSIIDDVLRQGSEAGLWQLAVILELVQRLLTSAAVRFGADKIRSTISGEIARPLDRRMEEFCRIAGEATWRLFDPSAWVRKIGSSPDGLGGWEWPFNSFS